MKRVAFLPLFFTALSVLFAGAVWLRLRSYEPIEMANATNVERRNSGGADEGVFTRGGSELTIGDGTQPSNVVRTSSSSNSERERRYNELLRSAPPPAPRPAPKPSLLDRMIAPLADALGVRPKAASPAPTAAQPAPRVQDPLPTSPRTPDVGRGEDRPGPGEEEDPDTDLVAPQLLAAEFQPPEVHDGEETVFAAIVNDNLSGVRSVSGVIASPSGSMQGFACLREAETNRFVAKIMVPKDAPAGMWVVKYLTLTDNASNSINLNAAQGGLPASASFRVTSADADATGPQLKGLWLDKQAMRGGDRNTVFVQADDDKVGVSLVSGVFVSPAKTARIGFGCKLGAGDTWECTFTPPTCLDCGVWRLEQVQLQDKANNLATFRNDNPLVSRIVLDIGSDRCDSAAPVITSLVLDPLVVSNAQATTIKVQATVVDEGGCGVQSLSGQATPPGGVGNQRRYISFGPSPDGQTFTGTLEIPQFAAKGKWSIAWIQALDKGHNLRAYSTNEPVVAGATFRVE
ncbi:MAG TPA: hypothetical protein VE974_01840 [Thermoanaerobaculia bacterium]|nr:hypothetical protein [Thermoanaerobaculia bacterium]